jgi:hypothetical protein
MGGIYSPSHRKLAVGERVPGYSGYISGYSRHFCSDIPDIEQLWTRNSYPETPGIYPDTPDIFIRIFRTRIRTLQVE